MIYFKLLFAFATIFFAGRLFLKIPFLKIDREPLGVRFPLYFFAGTAMIGLYMLFLSLLHFKYSVALIAFPFIVFSLPDLRLVMHIKPLDLKLPKFSLSIKTISFVLLAIICVAMLIDGFVSPLFSIDAYTMWFFKAKMIFMARRIPYEIFKMPVYSYTSPEYPLLGPLNLAWISFCLGEWNDILLRIFFMLQYILFIPFFYSSLKRKTNRNMAALGCLLLLANKHILVYAANGYQDLMVGMFAGISAVFFTRWMEVKDNRQLSLSAFFIGCAAFTKNEGIALFLALAITLCFFFFSNRKRVELRSFFAGFFAFIATAAAVFCPDKLTSLAYHMSSHMIKNANIISTTMANIGRFPRISAYFFYQLYLNTFEWMYFWIFITIFLIAGWDKIRKANLKYLLVFLMISLAFYFEVYMLTVVNNLETSLDRLLIGLAPAFVFLSFSAAPKDEDLH